MIGRSVQKDVRKRILYYLTGCIQVVPREGDSVHFKIAREFKDIFDRADANEVSLADPFQVIVVWTTCCRARLVS